MTGRELPGALACAELERPSVRVPSLLPLVCALGGAFLSGAAVPLLWARVPVPVFQLAMRWNPIAHFSRVFAEVWPAAAVWLRFASLYFWLGAGAACASFVLAMFFRRIWGRLAAALLAGLHFGATALAFTPIVYGKLLMAVVPYGIPFGAALAGAWVGRRVMCWSSILEPWAPLRLRALVTSGEVLVRSALAVAAICVGVALDGPSVLQAGFAHASARILRMGGFDARVQELEGHPALAIGSQVWAVISPECTYKELFFAMAALVWARGSKLRTNAARLAVVAAAVACANLLRLVIGVTLAARGWGYHVTHDYANALLYFGPLTVAYLARLSLVQAVAPPRR